MNLIDEWDKEPYSLLNAFHEYMRAKSKQEGEKPTTIEIKDSPIEVNVNKRGK